MTTKLDSYRYTDVAAHKSKDQIEKLLLRVGAVGFRWSSAIAQGEEAFEAALEWEGRQRGFRFTVRYVDEKQRKQVLRALYWFLKAKIEAIQFGLVELEQEFLPYLLTAEGRTVFEHIGGVHLNLMPPPSEMGESTT